MNAPQPELIPCKYCGKMITPGRNRTRKFCNPAEKVAFHRQKKNKAVTLIEPLQSVTK